MIISPHYQITRYLSPIINNLVSFYFFLILFNIMRSTLRTYSLKLIYSFFIKKKKIIFCNKFRMLTYFITSISCLRSYNMSLSVCTRDLYVALRVGQNFLCTLFPVLVPFLRKGSQFSIHL